MTDIKFAAIGINHSHIYGQVECLKRAGAQFVAFHAVEDDLAAAFSEKFPEARRVADASEILEDASIAVITTAAIPPIAPPFPSPPCARARMCSPTSRA